MNEPALGETSLKVLQAETFPLKLLGQHDGDAALSLTDHDLCTSCKELLGRDMVLWTNNGEPACFNGNRLCDLPHFRLTVCAIDLAWSSSRARSTMT